MYKLEGGTYMSDQRFDDLCRKLSGPQSRGSMLKTVLALAAGAALVPASAVAENDDRKRKNTYCLPKGHRCRLKGAHKCCAGLTCSRVACKQGQPCYRRCE